MSNGTIISLHPDCSHDSMPNGLRVQNSVGENKAGKVSALHSQSQLAGTGTNFPSQPDGMQHVCVTCCWLVSRGQLTVVEKSHWGTGKDCEHYIRGWGIYRHSEQYTDRSALYGKTWSHTERVFNFIYRGATRYHAALADTSSELNTHCFLNGFPDWSRYFRQGCLAQGQMPVCLHTLRQ